MFSFPDSPVGVHISLYRMFNFDTASACVPGSYNIEDRETEFSVLMGDIVPPEISSTAPLPEPTRVLLEAESRPVRKSASNPFASFVGDDVEENENIKREMKLIGQNEEAVFALDDDPAMVNMTYDEYENSQVNKFRPNRKSRDKELHRLTRVIAGMRVAFRNLVADHPGLMWERVDGDKSVPTLKEIIEKGYTGETLLLDIENFKKRFTDGDIPEKIRVFQEAEDLVTFIRGYRQVPCPIAMRVANGTIPLPRKKVQKVHYRGYDSPARHIWFVANRDKRRFSQPCIFLDMNQLLDIFHDRKIIPQRWMYVMPVRPGLPLSMENFVIVDEGQRAMMSIAWLKRKNPYEYMYIAMLYEVTADSRWDGFLQFLAKRRGRDWDLQDCVIEAPKVTQTEQGFHVHTLEAAEALKSKGTVSKRYIAPVAELVVLHKKRAAERMAAKEEPKTETLDAVVGGGSVAVP